ncbi:MAG TPA: cold-shock protein [Stellaceae bacterium]|nr:cold-shock protein [Stellaceae bacterium]
MSEGTVRWFNPKKGYRFIQQDDGSNDLFVHISAVERAGLPSVAEGQRVSFDVESGQRSKTSATNLKSIELPSSAAAGSTSAKTTNNE